MSTKEFIYHTMKYYVIMKRCQKDTRLQVFGRPWKNTDVMFQRIKRLVVQPSTVRHMAWWANWRQTKVSFKLHPTWMVFHWLPIHRIFLSCKHLIDVVPSMLQVQSVPCIVFALPPPHHQVHQPIWKRFLAMFYLVRVTVKLFNGKSLKIQVVPPLHNVKCSLFQM